MLDPASSSETLCWGQGYTDRTEQNQKKIRVDATKSALPMKITTRQRRTSKKNSSEAFIVLWTGRSAHYDAAWPCVQRRRHSPLFWRRGTGAGVRHQTIGGTVGHAFFFYLCILLFTSTRQFVKECCFSYQLPLSRHIGPLGPMI